MNVHADGDDELIAGGRRHGDRDRDTLRELLRDLKRAEELRRGLYQPRFVLAQDGQHTRRSAVYGRGACGLECDKVTDALLDRPADALVALLVHR